MLADQVLVVVIAVAFVIAIIGILATIDQWFKRPLPKSQQALSKPLASSEGRPRTDACLSVLTETPTRPGPGTQLQVKEHYNPPCQCGRAVLWVALFCACLFIPPRTDKHGRASMARRSEALACLSCLKSQWPPGRRGRAKKKTTFRWPFLLATVNYQGVNLSLQVFRRWQQELPLLWQTPSLLLPPLFYL